MKNLQQTNYLIVILLIALTLACTKAFATPQEDYELYQEAVRSSFYWGRPTSTFNFTFQMVEDIDGFSNGGCYISNQTKPVKIVIRRGFWRESDRSAKRAVMVHELGHCLMLLGHDPRPSQIMSPELDVTPQGYLLRLVLLTTLYSKSWNIGGRIK